MKFYEVLGIDPNATSDDIKRAYRKLSFEKHPDKNPNSLNEYQSINEAYETLRDPDKRSLYDSQNCFFSSCEPNNFDEQLNNIFSELLSGAINKGVKKGKGPAINDFASIFGMPSEEEYSPLDPSIFIRNSSNNVGFSKPEDIIIDQVITYEQAYTGCYIPIMIEREVVHSNRKTYEKETMYVDIKKGIDGNEIITVKDKGNVKGSSHSDVKVKILLEKTSMFSREGIDLILYKTISFKESLCGFKFDIHHLNGNAISFSSSRGNVIQNGDTKKIKNLGFSRDDIQGNLILTFYVSHPDTLSEEQLKLIEEVF